MGKNQWANYTKKKMDRNSDAKKLDNIQIQLEILNLPIHTVREKIFHNKNFTTKNNNHETDLLLNNVIHLHHDTVKIHGELGSPNKKTLQRDTDYERAGLPYIIINADLAKECRLCEADLAEYLYYHELQKQEVKNAIRM